MKFQVSDVAPHGKEARGNIRFIGFEFEVLSNLLGCPS